MSCGDEQAAARLLAVCDQVESKIGFEDADIIRRLLEAGSPDGSLEWLIDALLRTGEPIEHDVGVAVFDVLRHYGMHAYLSENLRRLIEPGEEKR